MITKPRRAMVIFAHPDDETGCSGTIASWIKEGTKILFLVCTNGDKGTENPEMTTKEMARIREQEMRNAAKSLGVQEIVFLGYADGELEDTRYFRGQIVKEIRRFRPETVLCQDTVSRSAHNHRDHRIAGMVALDALFPYARDPLHFEDFTKEGLKPHKVGTVLCWGAKEPTDYVDIENVIELKAKSMLCHRSQFVDRPSIDANHQPVELMKQTATIFGEESGFRYAEAFRKIEFRT